MATPLPLAHASPAAARPGAPPGVAAATAAARLGAPLAAVARLARAEVAWLARLVGHAGPGELFGWNCRNQKMNRLLGLGGLGPSPDLHRVLLILAPPIMRWLRLPRSRESPGLLSMSARWMEIQWDTGLDHSSGLFNIWYYSVQPASHHHDIKVIYGNIL